MSGKLRELFARLAGSSDSTRRTAAAFALGVFLSFSPFIGFQIATGLLLAFALKLNRAAVLIGVCTNLPWFVIPWYTATTLTAAAVLGQPIVADFGTRLVALLEHPFYRSAFWRQAWELVAPFFWSFMIGSTVGAAVIGIAAYGVTVSALARWRLARDAEQGAADRHVDEAERPGFEPDQR